MFNKGDNVKVNHPQHPGVWTVVKINQRTIGLTQGATRLNCDPYFLEVLTGDQVAAMPVIKTFVLGQVVEIDSRSHVGQKFVVIKMTGEKIRVAKLGGDDNRYIDAPRSRVNASSI